MEGRLWPWVSARNAPTRPLRSKRWPSLRTQLEASPQELSLQQCWALSPSPGHAVFSPALSPSRGTVCFPISGSRSTPHPCPGHFRRRPAVLCTLPGDVRPTSIRPLQEIGHASTAGHTLKHQRPSSCHAQCRTQLHVTRQAARTQRRQRYGHLPSLLTPFQTRV